jgi:lysozyme
MIAPVEPEDREMILRWSSEMIRHFEGWRGRAYRCPAGHWTIGYGHRLAEGEDPSREWSREESEVWLDRDIRQLWGRLLSMVCPALATGQWVALISFTYNVGVGAFFRSQVRQAVNREDHAMVPRHLRRWIYVRGMPMAGLSVRRILESKAYEGLLGYGNLSLWEVKAGGDGEKSS